MAELAATRLADDTPAMAGVVRTFASRAVGLACGAIVMCGAVGAAGPAHAGGSLLAGLTADQIASKALADLEAASSVHVTGWAAVSGHDVTFSLALTPGGCQGTMGVPHQGTFVFVQAGVDAWVKPSDQFWQSLGVPRSELPRVSGKWVARTPANANRIPGASTFCTPADVARGFGGPATGLVKEGSSTIAGQPAVDLKRTRDAASLDVSIAARPEFLRIVDPGRGAFTFSRYDARVFLTPPPAGDVIPLP
jgi:hypothetical protein